MEADGEGHREPRNSTATSSSRSVANLSLDKLYRKRAIDRENQRLLRQKNKDRLKHLEVEVQRLRRLLQESDQEKVNLQNRQAEHRDKIDAVISALQHLQAPEPINKSGDKLLATSSPALKQVASSLPSPAEEQRQTQATQVIDDPAFNFAGNVPDLDFWNHGGSLTFPLEGSTTLGIEDFSLDIESLTAGSFSSGFENFPIPAVPPADPGIDEQHHIYTPADFHDARAKSTKVRDGVHIWEMLPKHSPPHCPMDALVYSLIERRKKQASPDVGAAEFSNANFPSVSALLNPVLYEEDKPVASTIARHVASVLRVYTTPEKTANQLLYILCLLIRWLICPTEENYDSIPEFMRPTGHELKIPHPFWIGTIGWPRARERLVRHMDFTQWPTFGRIINRTFTINWPHQMDGILDGSPEKGFVLTQAFVDHVKDSSNWRVGQELVDTFPFLRGAVNIR